MKKILIPFLAIVLLFACTKPDGNGSDGTEETPAEVDGRISGFAQKGQLIKGSQITAYALGSDLVATGESFPAQISDDMGAFVINGKTSAPYLELNAQGYYYVENTGEISAAPIYLQALVPNGKASVNLNLLTTLIAPRVKKLISEGKSFKDAELQAQNELMRPLGYEELTYQVFSEMNIAGSSNSDAILLAASCLLQEGRSTGEVQSLITDIASSLEKNGVVSETLINKLFNTAGDIDIWDVTEGLVEYYTQKGIENFDIPPFYVILDEKYESGVHFLDDAPIQSITPEIMLGCNVEKEGTIRNHIVLCTDDFDVVSDCDWIKVEKANYIADFYTVKITIDANAEDMRTGTVQYRTHKGGSVTIEHEEVFKQMSGYPRLYIEIPSSGGTKATIEHPNSLEAGDKVSVNGVTYELQKDDIGCYVNVKGDCDVYRVCYPISSEYKDVNGNDVSFVPVQCYGDDYYYARVTYPAAGYPAGEYPFYGILVNSGDIMRIKLRSYSVGLMIVVDGIDVKDNVITLTSDKDMFGSFTYSNYLTESEVALNPSAVLNAPIVENGIKEVQIKLDNYDSSSDVTFGGGSETSLSTHLLQIPVQNYNFTYFDKQIRELYLTFEDKCDDGYQPICFSLQPVVDYLGKEGRIILVKISRSTDGSYRQSYQIAQM